MPNRTIPLILTPSTLMNLRPENLLAFRNSGISLSTLLHVDTIPQSSALAGYGANFALIDHNNLLPAFRSSRCYWKCWLCGGSGSRSGDH